MMVTGAVEIPLQPGVVGHWNSKKARKMDAILFSARPEVHLEWSVSLALSPKHDSHDGRTAHFTPSPRGCNYWRKLLKRNHCKHCIIIHRRFKFIAALFICTFCCFRHSASRPTWRFESVALEFEKQKFKNIYNKYDTVKTSAYRLLNSSVHWGGLYSCPTNWMVSLACWNHFGGQWVCTNLEAERSPSPPPPPRGGETCSFIYPHPS